MDLLPILNLFLALGGLVLMVVTIGLYIDWWVYKGRYAGPIVREYAWPIILLLTIGSSALTLVYSEYFGFIPCSLCWLQRVAIYPQALLGVLAYRRNDIIHFPIYGIYLSLFGLAVALYQYIYQMWPKGTGDGEIMPCLIDGTGADCAVKVIDEFGFMTFPLLSAISFAFLIVIYLYQKRS